jgi:hypothetical protein
MLSGVDFETGISFVAQIKLFYIKLDITLFIETGFILIIQ